MSPEILPNEFFDPGSISIPGGIETIIGTSQSALDQFQQLGLSTHAIVGTIFIGGLLLWLFGGKSLKIGFGLLGMLVGAQVGLIVPAAISASWLASWPSASPSPGPWPSSSAPSAL
ncbi:MAG: hypothetical protein ACNA8P_06565 [Phycisphaerales bacterium]